MCSLAVRFLSVHALCVGMNSLFTHVFTRQPRPLLPSCRYKLLLSVWWRLPHPHCRERHSGYHKQIVSASPWLLVVCACWSITTGDMVSKCHAMQCVACLAWVSLQWLMSSRAALKEGGACLQQQAVAKGSQACCSVTPPPFNTAIAFPPLKQPEMTELHEIIHFH